MAEQAMSWTLPLDTTETVRDYAAAVAVRNGATRDLAQDIAQITIMRLNEAAARNSAVVDLLARGSWRAYVATATRNVLAGYHRSEGRREKREESTALIQERLARPEEELDEFHAALLIEEMSAGLTREERVFIHLRYFQGLSIREIADELETTPARISHLGRAAVKKVARALEER